MRFCGGNEFSCPRGANQSTNSSGHQGRGGLSTGTDSGLVAALHGLLLNRQVLLCLEAVPFQLSHNPWVTPGWPLVPCTAPGQRGEQGRVRDVSSPPAYPFTSSTQGRFLKRSKALILLQKEENGPLPVECSEGSL